MTKEEAIICLKGIKNYGQNTFTEQSDWQNSIDMAIKALEQQPSEDCVSRQDVLDKAELIELEDGQTFYCISPEDVKALPPVTPTQSWIPVSEKLPKDLEPVNITWINHNPESYYANINDKPFTATGVYFNGQWYWWTT